MGLESGTYVQDLVSTNPVGATDTKAQGDDHLRLIKSVLKATFPNGTRPQYFARNLAKTANYTILEADMEKFITGDATGGAFNLTLPALVAGNDGWFVVIQKIDATANAVTVVGTINGLSNYVLSAQHDAMLFWWNGSSWKALEGIKSSRIVQTLTGDTTLGLEDVDNIILCNPGATMTLTLPPAASWKGRSIVFKQLTGSFSTVIDGNAAETIDGSANLTLSLNNEVVVLASDGTNVRSLAPSVGAAPNIFSAAQVFNETVTLNDDFVRPVVTLVDGANIAWDMSIGSIFKVTLGGNRTLDPPTGETEGETGEFYVIQDATGSRALTWDASYKFPNSADEKPDRTANSTTKYEYYVRGANDVIVKKIWTSASNSIGFYKEYDVGTYAADTTYTQAHGLGRLPAMIQAFLKVQAAEFGYAIDDYIDIVSIADDDQRSRSPTIMMNVTNVKFKTQNVAGFLQSFASNVQFTINQFTTLPKIIFRVYE